MLCRLSQKGRAIDSIMSHGTVFKECGQGSGTLPWPNEMMSKLRQPPFRHRLALEVPERSKSTMRDFVQ